MNHKVSEAWLAKDVSLSQEISWWLAETIISSVITYALITFADFTIPHLEGQYYLVFILLFLLIYLVSFITVDRAVTRSGTLRALVKGLLSLGLVLLFLSQPGYDETSSNVPRG